MLAAILRQNPSIATNMQSPLLEILNGMVKTMSGPEAELFITDKEREAILLAVANAYYADSSGNIVIDTNRGWTRHLSLLARLFPDARVLCCVRSPAWILDSVERNVQRNPLRASAMFAFDPTGTVYSRADVLMRTQFLGPSISALRQGWFGEHARKLVVIPYDTLTQRPLDIVKQLYDLMSIPYYAHDVTTVSYSAPEFDARLGFPDFHTVEGPVRVITRETILPKDLFLQHDVRFWESKDDNPRGVLVL